MTRQEAIKRLSLIMHSERIGWNPNTVEAFQMAIDALDEDKNVPSKDGGLISRQDAIRVVCGLDSSFVKYIEELPPAKPEPYEYAVSAMAVEEMLKDLLPERGMWEIEGDEAKTAICETVHDALDGLWRLPFVKPDSKELSFTQKAPDTISRQMAIDAFEDTTYTKNEIRRRITELPSAKPEPCEDCVSRKAVIRLLHSDYHNKSMIEEVKELPSAKPEPQWIPVSERLPEDTVIVTVETKTFKHKYVCEAVWIPRWSKKAEYDNWEDCSEYNEDEDEYYVLEGWYERVHNWDEYSFVGIEDDVIAWMPLPKEYSGE